jgi:hypothetical protein
MPRIDRPSRTPTSIPGRAASAQGVSRKRIGMPGCAPSPVLNLPDGYEDYRKSRHWLKVSRDIINRRGSVCEKCGQKGGKLEVHHLNYDRLGHDEGLPLPSEYL